jgi:hypothetical protein
MVMLWHPRRHAAALPVPAYNLIVNLRHISAPGIL